MGEQSGGPGPPNPFDMYSVLHRGEMPSVEMAAKRNFKALKHAYFTHPSDVEKYFVIGGDEFRKLDVFDIEDGLEKICKEGFNKATRLSSGDVLVQTKNAQQIEMLKSTTSFGDKKCPVLISENGVLNQSHAIIRCPEIMHLKIERIIEGLKKHYDVVNVQRLKRKVGNNWVDTATHVITFNSPIVPAEMKVGFLHVKTELYIPAPFRCAICQKLGHTKKRCNSNKNQPTCSFCGQAAHLYGPCLPPRCVNCHGDHPSSSKTCPRYLEEKEINAIRVSLRIPFKLAKEEFNKRRGRNPVPSNSAPSTSQQDHQATTSFSEVLQSSRQSSTATGTSKRVNNKTEGMSLKSKTIKPKVTQKEARRSTQQVKEDERLKKSMIESQTSQTQDTHQNYNHQLQTLNNYLTQNSTLSSIPLSNPLGQFRGFYDSSDGNLAPSCSRDTTACLNPYLQKEPEPPDIEISSVSDDPSEEDMNCN